MSFETCCIQMLCKTTPLTGNGVVELDSYRNKNLASLLLLLLLPFRRNVTHIICAMCNFYHTDNNVIFNMTINFE